MVDIRTQAGLQRSFAGQYYDASGELLLHIDAPTLRGAQLSQQWLDFADLSGQDLQMADLSGTSLDVAQLNGADLKCATMRDTGLAGTDLRGADLSGADLTDANLTWAKLHGAVLLGACMEGTAFIRCAALPKALGLDQIIHSGQSSMDIVTIMACLPCMRVTRRITTR